MNFGDTATRVLLAVVRQERPTVRAVAAEVGKSVMTVHHHLVKLRGAGLVQWDDRKRGTLRPMVMAVRTYVRYDEGANETAPRSAGNAPSGPRPTHLVRRWPT